jgi:hypothetical protein
LVFRRRDVRRDGALELSRPDRPGAAMRVKEIEVTLTDITRL